MARPWSRKGRDDGAGGGAPAPGRDDEHVDLDSEEHAWWAQRDVSEVWAPRDEHTAAAPIDGREGARDILADHLGEDWRTAFGFTTADGTPVTEAPDAEQAAARDAEAPGPEPVDTSDPYGVLEVASTATWEEIVDAHRRQARRHHPDRLVGRPDHEIAAAEDRIRHINAAYRELKVRRGK
jgi:hypothetical protein